MFYDIFIIVPLPLTTIPGFALVSKNTLLKYWFLQGACGGRINEEGSEGDTSVNFSEILVIMIHVKYEIALPSSFYVCLNMKNDRSAWASL